MAKVSVDVPVVIAWKIPWAGALASDLDKQKAAATKLAKYLTDGKMFVGHKQVQITSASAERVPDAEEPLAAPWHVVVEAEIQVEVHT
jgi:hypothetical protein